MDRTSSSTISMFGDILMILDLTPNTPVVLCSLHNAEDRWIATAFNTVRVVLRHVFLCTKRSTTVAYT